MSLPKGSLINFLEALVPSEMHDLLVQGRMALVARWQSPPRPLKNLEMRTLYKKSISISCIDLYKLLHRA